MQNEVATGKQLHGLPSSSLNLSGGSVLSTFRGANTAQAAEYGHAPISSESTKRQEKARKREREAGNRGVGKTKTYRVQDLHRWRGKDTYHKSTQRVVSGH